MKCNINIRPYIGIPYKAYGRSTEGADCWGIVWMFYQKELNIQLPVLEKDYSLSDSQTVADLVDITKPLLGASQVETPQIGDMVVMRFSGLPMHIGVWVGQGRVLHSLRGCDSVVEDTNGPRLKGRIEGYYRVS